MEDAKVGAKQDAPNSNIVGALLLAVEDVLTPYVNLNARTQRVSPITRTVDPLGLQKQTRDAPSEGAGALRGPGGAPRDMRG